MRHVPHVHHVVVIRNPAGIVRWPPEGIDANDENQNSSQSMEGCPVTRDSTSNKKKGGTGLVSLCYDPGWNDKYPLIH